MKLLKNMITGLCLIAATLVVVVIGATYDLNLLEVALMSLLVGAGLGFILPLEVL